jgi:hypothetical protein
VVVDRAVVPVEQQAERLAAAGGRPLPQLPVGLGHPFILIVGIIRFHTCSGPAPAPLLPARR